MPDHSDSSKQIVIGDGGTEQIFPPRPHLTAADGGDLIDMRMIAGSIIGIIAIFATIAIVFSPLVAAKILVSCFFAGVGMVCLVIFLFHRLILIKLMELEELGYQIRDDAVAHLAMGREGLEKLNRKLSGEGEDADQHSAMPELLKTVAPLLMFAVKKEKNLLRWGMIGLKFARSVSSMFKDKSK